MKAKNLLRITLVTILSLGLSSFALASGHGKGKNCDKEAMKKHQQIMESLSQDQRAELHKTMFDLWQKGATGQEIGGALADKVESFGFDLPDKAERGKHAGMRGGHAMMMFGIGGGPVCDQLTVKQRVEMREELLKQWKAGASPEEIHTSMATMLGKWNVEMPDMNKAGKHSKRHGKQSQKRQQMMASLTQEQRAELHQTMLDNFLAGADHETMRTQIQGKLKSYGVNVPCNCDGPQGCGPNGFMGGGPFSDLNISGDNYPNPFNPETTIKYDLKNAGDVTVAIYDINGKQIRTLVDGYQTNGSYEVVWDGKNDKGKQVATGTYFYQITAGSETLTKKMIMIK